MSQSGVDNEPTRVRCEVGNEEAYARDERPIKAKVGMFVDYSWFVCLALTGKFLPTCYVLQITYKNIPTDTK